MDPALKRKMSHGSYNTEEEVDEFLEILPGAIAEAEEAPELVRLCQSGLLMGKEGSELPDDEAFRATRLSFWTQLARGGKVTLCVSEHSRFVTLRS